jgi:hypothetical protein
MMVLGFAGLGFAGYRRAKASHATVARQNWLRMIRIAITAAAFEALAGTLPLG